MIVTKLPEWFPGASWKRRALGYREHLDAAAEEPFQFVKREMVRGVSCSRGMRC